MLMICRNYRKSLMEVELEMMNVEGLIRENVASHLQKYRLYLKIIHIQYLSSLDHLFTLTLAPQNLHKSDSSGRSNHYHALGAITLHYTRQMVSMLSLSSQMDPNSIGGDGGSYHHGFDPHSNPYNMTSQHRDSSTYQHHMTSKKNKAKMDLQFKKLNFLNWNQIKGCTLT